MNIAIRYIDAKYKKSTKLDLIDLRKDASKELREIQDCKSDIFNRYKGVHGRFQQSQLDVLDIREQKVCAMIDGIDKMIAYK